MTGARLSLYALCVAVVVGGACKKSGGTSPSDAAADASDAATERGPVLCTELDAGTTTGDGGVAAPSSDAAVDDGGNDGGTDAVGPPAPSGPSVSDEFGPNAPASKTLSSLGRVNLYEATSARWLQQVEVYLRAGLDHTRITVAIHEATGKDSPFKKLTDIQIDFATCEGWASSGPLAIPLETGRFYAIGYDPNQVLTAFISTDGENVPIDGAFGRLVGSKTATSVSVPTLTWDKVTDKEFNRQRLLTAPRAVPDAGTTSDASASDAGASDANASDAGAGANDAKDAAGTDTGTGDAAVKG